MKTYTVKNYKGNLVESLKKFSDSHKGMKIIEAVENGDNLKIKVKESEEKQITESTGKKVYVITVGNYTSRSTDPGRLLLGVFDNMNEATKVEKNFIKAAKEHKVKVNTHVDTLIMNEPRDYNYFVDQIGTRDDEVDDAL